jgi:hypothetical protein
MAGFQNDPGVTQQEAGFGFFGRFWTESFNDAMTAKASGTQSNSTQIDSMFCRFTTVATAGDGAVLPSISSFPGGCLSVCVINAASKPMTVYGNGSDTINTVAGATGVSVMPNSIVWFTATSKTSWWAQGLGCGFTTSGSNSTYSFADGLTATNPGAQANTALFSTSIGRFTTVGTAGDSTTLIPAVPGLILTVVNAGANIMSVFPASQTGGGASGGDTINSLGQNVAFAVPAGAVAEFVCTIAGTWHTIMTSTAANQAYNTSSTTSALDLGASVGNTALIVGGLDEVTLDLTGSLGGNVNLTLPTVAKLVTALTVAGLNPQPGMSYKLNVISRSAANNWTLITATGWTFSVSTATIAPNTMRVFYITIGATLAAATIKSVYSQAVTAA